MWTRTKLAPVIWRLLLLPPLNWALIVGALRAG
jgi:hypothetical protein